MSACFNDSVAVWKDPWKYFEILQNLYIFSSYKYLYNTIYLKTRQVAAILKQLLFTYTGKSVSRFTQVTLFIHLNTFVRDGFISLFT